MFIIIHIKAFLSISPYVVRVNVTKKEDYYSFFTLRYTDSIFIKKKKYLIQLCSVRYIIKLIFYLFGGLFII